MTLGTSPRRQPRESELSPPTIAVVRVNLHGWERGQSSVEVQIAPDGPDQVFLAAVEQSRIASILKLKESVIREVSIALDILAEG